MRYIPKAATKVVVYHPACVMPSEVQEQLQKMTSNFMVKATGEGLAAMLSLAFRRGKQAHTTGDGQGQRARSSSLQPFASVGDG